MLPEVRGHGGFTSQSTRAGLLLGEDLVVNVPRIHYICAAVGSNETKFLYRVKKGMRVITATIRLAISASGGALSTWSIGDASNTVGYVLATSCVGTPGSYTDSIGTYSVGRAGKIYNAVDSINLYYTATGTPGTTPPTCDIRLVLQQEWAEV